MLVKLGTLNICIFKYIVHSMILKKINRRSPDVAKNITQVGECVATSRFELSSPMR